jgi:hypothetical protein
VSDKDLKLTPTEYKFQKDVWWYEEPDGIHIFDARSGGDPRKSRILWRSIRAALKRKDKP